MTNHEDTRAGWAAICADFHVLRLDALRLGFQQRWRACARAGAAGADALARWRSLMADIAAADGVEVDFTGRNGGTAEEVRRALAVPAARYTCPDELCDRTASPTVVGGTPVCALLNKDMRDDSTG